MSTLEANMALLAAIPEEKQQEIHSYLLMIVNSNSDNPFKPLSRKEIYQELEESRACFSRGEYMDFETALDEIGERYDL
ncbi:MAG: hypothetical protein IJN92_09940 [Lachnospiraceae bacterium]|nr:hypothetical protein [Lachnospiraceae bacterium]